MAKYRLRIEECGRLGSALNNIIDRTIHRRKPFTTLSLPGNGRARLILYDEPETTNDVREIYKKAIEEGLEKNRRGYFTISI
jgi:hypothetical protein